MKPNIFKDAYNYAKANPLDSIIVILLMFGWLLAVSLLFHFKELYNFIESLHL